MTVDARADEDEPLEQFSFLRLSECHMLEEIQDQIEKLTMYDDLDEDHFLVRALRRGIGIHHSGLPTKYRKTVEILFRAKFLRLVIATGEIHDAEGTSQPTSFVMWKRVKAKMNLM